MHKLSENKVLSPAEIETESICFPVRDYIYLFIYYKSSCLELHQ